MKGRMLGTLVMVAVLALGGACGDDDDGASEATTTTAASRAAVFGTVKLSGGASEVPQPGDPDGSGTATISVDEGSDGVCYEITVQNIGPPVMAHIHEGAAGTAGPIVITFDPEKIGQGQACLSKQPADVLAKILDNPAGYYVNVHTADFPGGAVRGQLR